MERRPRPVSEIHSLSIKWCAESPSMSEGDSLEDTGVQECDRPQMSSAARCQAAVEVPSWRIVPDYDPGTTEWKRPEDEYIKAPQAIGDTVEYDLDEQDEKWLNKHSHYDLGSEGWFVMTEEILEVTIDHLEKCSAHLMEFQQFSLDDDAQCGSIDPRVLCGICGKMSKKEDLVSCVGCNVSCHAECGAIKKLHKHDHECDSDCDEESDNNNWMCDRCKYCYLASTPGRHTSGRVPKKITSKEEYIRKYNTVPCLSCGRAGGLMKKLYIDRDSKEYERLIENRDKIATTSKSTLPTPQLSDEESHDFVHVLCALWVPTFSLDFDGISISGNQVKSTNKKVYCVHCSGCSGLIKCSAQGCKARYHPSCAMSEGQILDIRDNKFVSYCIGHTCAHVQDDDNPHMRAMLGRFIDADTKAKIEEMTKTSIPSAAFNEMCEYWKNKRWSIEGGRKALIGRLYEESCVRSIELQPTLTKFVNSNRRQKYFELRRQREDLERLRELNNLVRMRENTKLNEVQVLLDFVKNLTAASAPKEPVEVSTTTKATRTPKNAQVTPTKSTQPKPRVKPSEIVFSPTTKRTLRSMSDLAMPPSKKLRRESFSSIDFYHLNPEKIKLYPRRPSIDRGREPTREEPKSCFEEASETTAQEVEDAQENVSQKKRRLENDEGEGNRGQGRLRGTNRRLSNITTRTATLRRIQSPIKTKSRKSTESPSAPLKSRISTNSPTRMTRSDKDWPKSKLPTNSPTRPEIANVSSAYIESPRGGMRTRGAGRQRGRMRVLAAGNSRLSPNIREGRESIRDTESDSDSDNEVQVFIPEPASDSDFSEVGPFKVIEEVGQTKFKPQPKAQAKQAKTNNHVRVYPKRDSEVPNNLRIRKTLYPKPKHPKRLSMSSPIQKVSQRRGHNYKRRDRPQQTRARACEELVLGKSPYRAALEYPRKEKH